MENEYNRLEYVANTYFKGVSDLARKLNIMPQALYVYKQRRGFGKEYLSKFEGVGINPRYIQYNELPHMLNRSIAKETGDIGVDISDLFEIEVYDMPANANVGSLVSFYDLPVSLKKLSLSMKLDPANLKGIRVTGDSMKDAYIRSGGIAIYDTKAQAINGDVIVAVLNNVILIKSYIMNNGILELHSAANGIPPIIVNEIDDKLIILGVVRAVLNYF